MPKLEQDKYVSSRLLKNSIRTAERILAGIGLLLLLVTLTPADVWWAEYLAGPSRGARGDVLIVLGGSVLQGGIMGESSYSRAVFATRAWKEGGFSMIVISGGPPGHSAAQGIRDFLVAQGVPRESIRTETQSQSTRENALFTESLLESIPGRKVLLTGDAHMYRAQRVFRKLNIEVLPRPCPEMRSQAQLPLGGFETFVGLVEETAKIGYYYLRGWI